MDIDLLSKMVRETILDHDAVTLPGIGSFMAEIVPSMFTDKGYTIHPPYRRLFFSRREEGDTLLRDLYAESNDIPLASAERIVTEFLAEMKEVLKEKKTVVFPGLGRLRATKENNFFFVADEDLDIYPAGFGLKPVSLKTHQETEEEVSEMVAGLANILSEPIDEPVSKPAAASSAEPAPVPAAQPSAEPAAPEKAPVAEPEAVEAKPVAEPVDPWAHLRKKEEMVEKRRAVSGEKAEEAAPKRRSAWKRLLVALAVLAAVALVLLVAYVVVARVAPDFVDRFLYSAEELEFIRKAY